MNISKLVVAFLIPLALISTKAFGDTTVFTDDFVDGVGSEANWLQQNSALANQDAFWTIVNDGTGNNVFQGDGISAATIVTAAANQAACSAFGGSAVYLNTTMTFGMDVRFTSVTPGDVTGNVGGFLLVDTNQATVLPSVVFTIVPDPNLLLPPDYNLQILQYDNFTGPGSLVTNAALQALPATFDPLAVNRLEATLAGNVLTVTVTDAASTLLASTALLLDPLSVAPFGPLQRGAAGIFVNAAAVAQFDNISISGEETCLTLTTFSDDYEETPVPFTESNWKQALAPTAANPAETNQDALWTVDADPGVAGNEFFTGNASASLRPAAAAANRLGCSANNGFALYRNTVTSIAFDMKLVDEPPPTLLPGEVDEIQGGGFLLGDVTHPTLLPVAGTTLTVTRFLGGAVSTFSLFQLDDFEGAAPGLVVVNFALPPSFDPFVMHHVEMELRYNVLSGTIENAAGVIVADLFMNLNPLIAAPFTQIQQGIAGVWVQASDVANFDNFVLTGDEICLDNTPAGVGVIVPLIQGITADFDNVTTSGSTTVDRSIDPPLGVPVPSSFQVAGEYFDVSTDATFTGNITLCFPYDDTGLTLTEEQNLSLLHFNAGTGLWDDITLSVDTDLNVLCGVTSELSPFVVGLLLNAPPVANAGPDQTLECTGLAGALASLDGSQSTDTDSTVGTNDDIIAFQWFLNGAEVASTEHAQISLPLGNHTLTLVVTDSAGEFDTDTVLVSVQDNTPPTLSLTASPHILWPANHKLIDVVITATVSDLCDAAPTVVLVSVTNNESDDSTGGGDGNTDNDVQNVTIGTADFDVSLRAERRGKGTGRTYTLTYRATDAAGNSIDTPVTVDVPHDGSTHHCDQSDCDLNT